MENSGSFETPCFFSGLRLSFVNFFQFVSLLHLEFLQDTVIGATAMIEDQRALGFIPQDVNGTRGLGKKYTFSEGLDLLALKPEATPALKPAKGAVERMFRRSATNIFQTTTQLF